MLVVKAQAAMGQKTLDVDFSVDGILGIYGPSGAGKSTVLNCILGLRPLTAGTVCLDGLEIQDLPVHLRRIGMVFQDDRLLPHLTVQRNLDYGRKGNPIEPQTVLEPLGLSKLLDRRPAVLSGGERRRVALARALLSNPRCLLLDEPFTGLDSELRHRAIKVIRAVRTALAIPMICVSHDLNSLVALGGGNLCIEHGQITQRGLPSTVSTVTYAGQRLLVDQLDIVVVPVGTPSSGTIILEGQVTAQSAEGVVVTLHTGEHLHCPPCAWATMGTAVRCVCLKAMLSSISDPA